MSKFPNTSEYQTSQSSFSAVSKPIFAPEYAFSAFFEIYKTIFC